MTPVRIAAADSSRCYSHFIVPVSSIHLGLRQYRWRRGERTGSRSPPLRPDLFLVPSLALPQSRPVALGTALLMMLLYQYPPKYDCFAQQIIKLLDSRTKIRPTIIEMLGLADWLSWRKITGANEFTIFFNVFQFFIKKLSLLFLMLFVVRCFPFARLHPRTTLTTKTSMPLH